MSVVCYLILRFELKIFLVMLFVCFCLRRLLPLEVRYSPKVSFLFKRCSPPALNTFLYECECSEVLVWPRRNGNRNVGVLAGGIRVPSPGPGSLPASCPLKCSERRNRGRSAQPVRSRIGARPPDSTACTAYGCGHLSHTGPLYSCSWAWALLFFIS